MGDPPGDTAQATGERRIVWESSNARNAYANAVDVMSTREEVSLLLGTTQIGRRDDKAQAVALTNRIAMTPSAAKRLALQLSNVLREYESKYGPLEAEILSRPAPSGISEPSGKQSVQGAHEGAGALFHLVEGLNVGVGFERSFKIVDANLFDNRFLLGVSKAAIGSGAEDKLINICSLLGMPEKLLHIFRSYLTKANYVHFGFEQTKQSAVYKVYLEFHGALKEEFRKSDQRPGPALLHLGLKWDVFNPTRQVLTRYTWHPWLSPQEIMQAVGGILAPHTKAPPKQAADELISLAIARAPYRDILYLDVMEDGNPRRSFDINVYRANLRIEEVYPLLSVLCRRHSIPFDTFHSLYHRIKTKRLGHLAAGVDRNGKDFFTIYYGVEGIGDVRTKERLKEDLEIRTKYSTPVRRQRISRIEETDDEAGRLFRLVMGLGVKGAFERSFKFLNRALLNDRFLIGFKRETTSTEQDNAILEICRLSKMPQEYLKIFRAELNEAKIVLFGFEKNEKSRLYKAYLEFSGRLDEAASQHPGPKSVVTHSGFKWDVSDNSRRMLARYTAYPFLRAEEMAARIMSSFYGDQKEAPFPVVDDILDLVGSRTRPGEILYCETNEAGNPRSSFDINAYRANVRMAEIYPMLLKAARHYSIDLNGFEELYEGAKYEKFGHLSGGTDREGRDFLTFYFSQRGSRASVALTQKPHPFHASSCKEEK